jgi:protein-disulfide isomerase
VPFAQALNEWVFQNPVPNTVDTNVRLEGTPTVVVNGVVYPGDAADPAEFKAFVKGLAL